ncbi:MAG: molybdenum cofactor cytidylyltransferase [Verrucomicrobiota bacterium]
MRNIGALILAAGQSSRLGRPKQLLKFREKSFLRRIVDEAGKAGCNPVTVVLGSDCEKLAAELSDTSATIVENDNWSRGIGTSIRSGLKGAIAAVENLDAVILLTCDQPLIDTEIIARLIQLQSETGKTIVASAYADTLGVPALFARSCFAELLELPDTSGAKSIITSRPDRVAEIPIEAAQTDIDTESDYERLIRGRSKDL